MAEINQAKDFLLKWYSRFGPEEEEGEEMEEEKIEIKLDAEIMHLIPPPTEDELQRLEQSIIDEGCRDPLVLWDDILLDGHIMGYRTLPALHRRDGRRLPVEFAVLLPVVEFPVPHFTGGDGCPKPAVFFR